MQLLVFCQSVVFTLFTPRHRSCEWYINATVHPSVGNNLVDTEDWIFLDGS